MFTSVLRYALVACLSGLALPASLAQTLTENPPASSTIRLRYAAFDPLVGLPEVAAELRCGEEHGLWIVQFMSTPTEAGRSAIVDGGGEVIGYLPDNAYVVRMQPIEAAALRGGAEVRWVGPYHPAFRLQPELLRVKAYAHPQARRYHIVVADKQIDKPGLIDKVEEIGGRVDDAAAGSLLLGVTLTGPQLLQVAGLDEVLWIDLWTPAELDMDNARIQGGANYVESQAGYTGGGVHAHVYEGIEAGHMDFTGGAVNVLSNGMAQAHGHATAGVLFGNGASNPLVRGMAPDAGKFFTHFTSASASRYQVVSDLVNVHDVSHTTASWGSARTFFYTSISAATDDIIFDHDIGWTQSHSNSGVPDARPESWAKNIFSIGGVVHFDNSDPSDDSWGAGGAGTGPAFDGRIKPTLCAYADAIGTSDLTGSAGYSPANWFAGFGGTSGSTPMVAGHNVLAIQMFTDEVATGFGPFGNPLRVPGGTSHQNRPHFPTLKALQVISANQYAFTGASVDNRREHQGWGFPNLQNMWDDRAKTFIVDESDVLVQGQTRSYSITVGPGEPALRACLNWSEPPGNPAAASQLVNNLSLRLTSPDGTETFWGNHELENGVWSTAGGSEDVINSIECVFVQAPASGNWRVDVVASSIVQDNHVETPAVDADYGLVVTGGVVGLGAPICAGEPNSTGTGATLLLSGSSAVADMDLTVSIEHLPQNSLGYAVTSMETHLLLNPGGSMGNLCIAGATIGRFIGDVLDSGATGTASFSPDLAAFPSAAGSAPVLAGETRHFQYWYRDALGGSATSNFSSAQSLTFE